MSIQAKVGASSMVLDVKGAYLKPHVDETKDERLYVKLPDGRVVKLQKYLYGLKQAGLEWEKNVFEALLKKGYTQSEHDTRAFAWKNGDSFINMCIHVDDFFVIASDQELLTELYDYLVDVYGEVT